MTEQKKDKFEVTLVESASPLTKKPGTPFRVAALGIKKEEFCYEREETTEKGEKIHKPSPLPILPFAPKPQCQLQVEQTTFVGMAGEWVYTKVDHGEYKPISVASSSPTVLVRLNGDGVEMLCETEGTNNFTIIFTYENGLKCSVEMTIALDGGYPPNPEPPTDVKYTFAMCNTTSDPGDVYSASLDGVQFADKVDIETGGHTNFDLKLTPGKHSITVTLDKGTKAKWLMYLTEFYDGFFSQIVNDSVNLDLDNQTFMNGTKSWTVEFTIEGGGK